MLPKSVNSPIVFVEAQGYLDFLISKRLQLIYLDEMFSAIDKQSLEVSLIQLFGVMC